MFIKIKILIMLLQSAFEEWSINIKNEDLDSRYCCDGRECCCGGATKKEFWGCEMTRLPTRKKEGE